MTWELCTTSAGGLSGIRRARELETYLPHICPQIPCFYVSSHGVLWQTQTWVWAQCVFLDAILSDTKSYCCSCQALALVLNLTGLFHLMAPNLASWNSRGQLLKHHQSRQSQHDLWMWSSSARKGPTVRVAEEILLQPGGFLMQNSILVHHFLLLVHSPDILETPDTIILSSRSQCFYW